jgi:hypothetical protein
MRMRGKGTEWRRQTNVRNGTQGQNLVGLEITVLRYSIRLSQVTDPCAEPKFGLGHGVTWLSAGGLERSQND